MQLNISSQHRRAQRLAVGLALAALLVTTMFYERTGPPTAVNSWPDQGEGCYCHQGMTKPAQINGTDASQFVAQVNIGDSFVLLVKVQFSNESDAISTTLGWPDTDDNSKFAFDPREISNNSPQDMDQSQANILAPFKITAPSEPGSYLIALFCRGSIFEIDIEVGEGRTVSTSFAAISAVDHPGASRVGEIVRVNVTLRNNGSMPKTFYVYATNGSSRQVIFDKVYSGAPVNSKATITLTGAFEMPNSTLILRIRSGHVEEKGDVDDDRFVAAVLPSLPAPQIKRVPLSVLGGVVSVGGYCCCVAGICSTRSDADS